MTRWGVSEKSECGLPQAGIVALKKWGELLNRENWNALSPEENTREAEAVPFYLGLDRLRGHESLTDPARACYLVMDRGESMPEAPHSPHPEVGPRASGRGVQHPPLDQSSHTMGSVAHVLNKVRGRPTPGLTRFGVGTA